MLSRQKALLTLLSNVDGQLTRLSFVKLVFLLRQEYPVADELAFYDFVPYKYGPFSFTLYHEMDVLAEQGYSIWGDDCVALAPGARDTAGPLSAELPETVVSAVRSICERFHQLGQWDLVGEVYRRYPWYASRSELRGFNASQSSPSTPGEVAVYTVGYAGKSVDAFFDNLLAKGICAIIDVRANPVSRKYGFSRKSLGGIACKLGMDYVHEGEVGIPSALRRHIDSDAALDALLDTYEREILPKKGRAVERVSQLVHQKPSAMMCAEEDARHCHRGRLASLVSVMTGLEVVHL
jgi:hypothetical protein